MALQSRAKRNVFSRFTKPFNITKIYLRARSQIPQLPQREMHRGKVFRKYPYTGPTNIPTLDTGAYSRHKTRSGPLATRMLKIA